MGPKASVEVGQGETRLLADANQPRPQGREREELRECAGERVAGAGGSLLADSERKSKRAGRPRGEQSLDWWAIEPDVGRVAHGIPSRVDRLRALGNAVVPQVVECIGRAIMETEYQAQGASE